MISISMSMWKCVWNKEKQVSIGVVLIAFGYLNNYNKNDSKAQVEHTLFYPRFAVISIIIVQILWSCL